MSNIVECGACGAPTRFGHSEEDCETIKELRVALARLSADLAAADTTRREWEVRAATSYADGRKAGLRELVEVVREARAAAGGSRCVHTDPDECCDQCRVAATLNRPVLNGMLAAVRLSEFILSTPDVLAAVEALDTLGKARAQREVASFPSGMGDGGMSARQDAGQAMRRALAAIDELADRLAARKGE